MEFKQLQSFVAVVHYDSFTKAAEKLYLSQPTISTHIRLLEEELHTQLIIRSTKSIEVTPKGRELYECACNILKQRDNLITNWEEEDRKIIYVGTSTIPSAYILPEVLPQFRRNHPDVQFSIRQGDSEDIINGLLNCDFTIGLVGMEIQHEAIVCQPFYRDRMVLITPPTEPFLQMQNDGACSKEIFFQHPVLLREVGSGSQHRINAYFEQVNISDSQLQIIARLNDQESIKNLVSGGLGIAFISEKAVQDYQDEGKLLVFDLPEASAQRNLCLVYRKKDILKSHVLQFIDAVTQTYRHTLTN